MLCKPSNIIVFCGKTDRHMPLCSCFWAYLWDCLHLFIFSKKIPRIYSSTRSVLTCYFSWITEHILIVMQYRSIKWWYRQHHFKSLKTRIVVFICIKKCSLIFTVNFLNSKFVCLVGIKTILSLWPLSYAANCH